MRILLILHLCIFPAVLFSQPINFSAYKMNNGKRIDSSQTAFKKILNQQFSSLITGQSKNAFGSFAAVDLGASEVSFAGSHVFKKDGTVFTVKANGGISDGFLTLFNNSTFNSNIGLDINLHFLRLNKRMLEYDADSADQFNDKVDKMKYEFDAKNIDINWMADSVALEIKNAKTSKLISNLADSISKEKDPLKQASFKLEREKANLLLDSIKNALINLPLDLTLKRNLRNRILEKLEALSFESGVLGFSFNWWSVGYKVNNNKFKLLNGSLPLAQQVYDTSFVSHAVRVQFSNYYLRAAAFRTHFWDLGAIFEFSDNFGSLKKKELSEIKEYGTIPGQRQATKKYSAYEGTYESDLKGLTLYGDFYYFLFRNNIAAIHINPEWVIKSSLKPVANFYVGFLLTAKSAKTANSVVNFELFYKFLDLFKTTDTEYDLFERNSIGIRFAFPIAFKYNKIE